MTYSTLNELTQSAQDMRGYDPDYYDKQIHAIPNTPVVDRIEFLTEQAEGKIVLNIGSASGGLHGKLKEVAKKIYGLDKDAQADIVIDLDHCHLKWVSLPDDVEVVIAGEVIEHLSSPGLFLERMADYGKPLIITTPNAFVKGGWQMAARGKENVNIDHVAWYSHRTLKTLLERFGFEIQAFYWYGGEPRISEGMIAVATERTKP